MDNDDVINLEEVDNLNNQNRNKIYLTENDKQRIKETMKVMEDNMIKPQVVKGKVFEGPGFASNPEKVVFKDFELGNPMEITIDIINISLCYNSFKLLPLDEELIDFFEISYKPCGRLPAGISTTITLKFIPIVNKDAFGYLKLLSETGLCKIPIECLTKKCVIEIDSNILDFGDVILGQSLKLQLNIHNKGALKCNYKFLNEFEEEFDLEEIEKEKEEEEEELLVNEEMKQFVEYTEPKAILYKNKYIESFNEIKDYEYYMKKNADKEAQDREDEIYRYNRLKEELNKSIEENSEEKDSKFNNNINNKNMGNKNKTNNIDDKLVTDNQQDNLKEPKNYDLEHAYKKIEENYLDKYKKLKDYFILKQLVFPYKGEIEGYSSKKITVILNALFIGEFKNEFLNFKVFYNNNKNNETFKIHLLYNIIDFPIYTDYKTHNLNYLTENDIFRDKVTFHNNSNISYKIQAYQHISTRNIIEINPDLGFIQANSSFDIWIKLKANKRDINKLNNFFYNNSLKNTTNAVRFDNTKQKDIEDAFGLTSFSKDTTKFINVNKEVLNIPIKIQITNINLPLLVTLKFSITNSDLLVSPLHLVYDKLFIDESKTIDIFLTNNSKLPQHYGFIMLPKEFTIVPNIGTVLPNEKVVIKCNYQSFDNNIGHRTGDIFCKVTANELSAKTIKIGYHCEIVNNDLSVKPKLLQLPILQENEIYNKIICVKNLTDNNYVCEWLTPLSILSGIEIMPKVFKINKNSYNTCAMEFKSNFRSYNANTMNKIIEELISLNNNNLVEINCKDEFNEKYNLKAIISNNNNNNINNIPINPKLEEKIKFNVNSVLIKSNEVNDNKANKKVSKKEDKRVEKKKEEKKDKKQLEDEEKKKYEERTLLKEKEEKDNLERLKNFDELKRNSELELFGVEKNYFSPDFNEFNNEEETAIVKGNLLLLLLLLLLIFTFIIENIYKQFNKSEHNKVLIPLFYKIDLSENNSKLISNKLKLTFIEINTSTCDKKITFDKEALNFGEVSVKTRKTLNLGITNNTREEIDISVKPLIISNCFTIVNALRAIPPKSSFNIIVDFVPNLNIPYYETLTIISNKYQASINLIGNGVCPEIETSITNGFMFMGNTVVNNNIEKVFTIKNNSKFPITYNIKTILNGKNNKNNVEPFTYYPITETIEGNKSIEVKVVFYSDHQDYKNYFNYILIDVPNQKTENYILINASSWNRQAYVRKYFIPYNIPLEKLLKKEINQVSFNDIYYENPQLNSILINNQYTKSSSITLLFKKLDDVAITSRNINNIEMEDCFRQKLIIGNCKLIDSKLEKNINYEVIIPKEDIYFSCDNPKGSVNSGNEVIVAFNFKKPPPDPILGHIEELSNIGMWINTKVEVRITGGYIATNESDLSIIEVELKAYVNQL